MSSFVSKSEIAASESSVSSHPLAFDETSPERKIGQSSKYESNPPAYTLRRDATRTSSSAASQPRPNYFDLQRLAAAQAEETALERERLVNDHRDSISASQSATQSAFYSSRSTSSQASDDGIEEVDDEVGDENEEIPQWIKSADIGLPSKRPQSRNSVFSAVPSRSSNRESQGGYPNRNGGIISRSSMRSPPPGATSFNTMMPPSRASTPYNDLVVNAPKKNSHQFLTSLHLMTDDELDRHLGAPQSTSIRPSASPIQSLSASISERSESTASRSRFSGMMSVSPRSESPQTERSQLGLLVPDTKQIHADESLQRQRHKLIRELSERLGELTMDAERSRQTLERKRDQLLLALGAKKKESEAREEALKEILISMGVSTARIDRALVQAVTQAKVPVFRADERVVQSPITSFNVKSHAAKDTEQMLPESLREAMLEEMIESSSESQPSNDVTQNTIQLNGTGKHHLSPTSSIRGDNIRESRILQPNGKAAWGSGLVPWSRSGPTSKKAIASIQATSPAAVEADGYFSDVPSRAPSHDTPSPSPHRGRRQSSRSSSISAVMSRMQNDSDAEEEEGEQAEYAVKKTWTDAASRGAFGLLGSLAWRRKKPSLDTVNRRRAAHNIPQIQTQPVSHDSEIARKSRDDVSHKSKTRRSSTSSHKQADDSKVDEDDKNEDTLRARSMIARPQARYTLSGRDVISALYEAIGSAPPSPEIDRKQPLLPDTSLPKPSHFKAICLATRIMTSESSSILLDKGKMAGPLIHQSSLALVQRAREEGKEFEEHHESAKKGRKSSLAGQSAAREKVVGVDRDARAVLPVKSPQAAAVSTTTTLSNTLGKYAKQTQSLTEPNVTRLPNLFGFANASIYGSGQTSAAKKLSSSKKISVKKSEEDKKTASSAPIVTELEPILAHDVKPPTFALSARRSIYLPHPAPKKRRGTIDSLGKLSEGEESSGDEFEVYGGKHLQDDDSNLNHKGQGQIVDTDNLLTDRYGFVYDATPADVRLLRRAKKESTHAPACLTGIRVGVRARGGSDSQSEEDKDYADGDLVEAEDDLEISKDTPIIREEDVDTRDMNESDNASQKTVSSHKTAGTSGAVGNGTVGLLTVKAGKAVAQATTLSAASQSSSSPGPTCPVQEKIHFEGQEEAVTNGKVSHKRPPSTSQTVKRLLGQLQEMHLNQQNKQQLEWDGFFKKRKASIREGKVETADAMRKSGDSINKLAKTNSSAAAFSRYESNALSEEEWHLGGLVGLNRMGTESKDYQEFTRLLHKGIPLLYRPKVWYECSGAMELNEPGKYQELLLDHENEENQCTNQIDLDIGRTMPTNIYFSGDGPGVIKLRRLLVAFSWFNPKCGYCQGMNNLAATLLLTHATEEDAFWVLVSIIERILPEEYYTSHLLVSQADQRVLMDLMDDLLPQLSAHIRDLGVDLPAVTFAWFLSLYTDCLPVETLFRVWDVMFVEGMVVLFRVAIAIFIINEKELLDTTSTSEFYSFVHGMTSHLFSADKLIKIACEDLKSTVKKETIIERREKHAKDLSIEMGIDTPSDLV